MVPHDGPGCQNGGTRPAKRWALGTKNKRIRLQIYNYAQRSDLETNIQEPASQHTFQQRKNDQEANIQKPAARGPAAVGETHKMKCLLAFSRIRERYVTYVSQAGVSKTKQNKTKCRNCLCSGSTFVNAPQRASHLPNCGFKADRMIMIQILSTI